MEQQAKDQTVEMMKHFIDGIEKDKVKWVHLTIQYNNGRVCLATEGAPDRPKGLGHSRL